MDKVRREFMETQPHCERLFFGFFVSPIMQVCSRKHFWLKKIRPFLSKMSSSEAFSRNSYDILSDIKKMNDKLSLFRINQRFKYHISTKTKRWWNPSEDVMRKTKRNLMKLDEQRDRWWNVQYISLILSVKLYSFLFHLVRDYFNGWPIMNGRFLYLVF
jgi:hypothetical protein